MKGVPEARAVLGRLEPGAAAVVEKLGREHERHRQGRTGGASWATWRRVAAVASRVRYMVTPAEATTAG